MKTNAITSALFALLFASPIFAQDRTTVNATSSEISDNLDLRAVASIFGEAKNLEDFERQLNNPETQISNLDLNNDNRVDYLRVIETVEGYTHLVVVQAVLGRDTFQDVATIEVERDSRNQVSVQVVGDVYMYGPNYIYEPVYVQTPIIYTSFWVTSYRPYASLWYWDYYPTYYYAWNPCPIFRYRRNVNVYINFSNHYDYVSVRRSQRAVALYTPRRANYCERQYPTRSFAYRNTTVKNRYELDQTRNVRNVSTRYDGVAYNNPGTTRRNDTQTNLNPGREKNYAATRAEQPIKASSNPIRENNAPKAETNFNTRTETNIRSNNPVRNNSNSRAETNSQPTANPIRNNTPRTETNIRTNSAPIRQNTQMNTATPRANQQQAVQQASNQRGSMSPRQNSGGGNTSRGNNERDGRR